ncbi:MAG: DUF3302 domain-containing protein [Gammaproteobacteria bacterium]|nr:DUF3302 domain-containing protein [Gammaproteobacteria bacterium]
MLDYVALGILIFAGVTLFYGIIVIHDIPYEIAVHRNHPHQDAIHYAGWVSLFTLHAIWPFLWIWSTLYREERGWGFEQVETEPDVETEDAETEATRIEPVVVVTEAEVVSPESFAVMRHKLEAIEDRIERIEQAILAASEAGNNDGGAG